MNHGGLGDDAPVYVISVAAELSGLHPQTLRQYDRLGLVSPGRATGRGRRYSARDVQLLREVQRLSQEEGINLAGIKRILELQREVDELREAVFHLRNELEAARSAVARRGASAQGPAAPGGELMPVRRTRVTLFGAAAHPERPDERRENPRQDPRRD
ncbi:MULTISPECIES: heat shock protein transcriptional repressor HspR [Nocardiopsis]|uniref:heat shock protein transcriptional repressor HspR n=1 Tax=Nocardiopsis TaxID=2013 RepID=UPI0005850842